MTSRNKEIMWSCDHCKQRVPHDCIAPFFNNGQRTMACAVCALEIRNATHGFSPGTPFGGEIAQEMYERCVAFKRKNK
jgi:hypothetical protein